jgi:hypothetical protein
MEMILKQLINDGLTIPKIAEKIGKSPSSVCRLLKKYNLKTKRHICCDDSATSKECRYCGVSKKIEEFPKAATHKGKDYRRHKCHSCYMKTKAIRQKFLATWLQDYKKTLQCVCCGNSDFRVLDFHHCKGKKEFNVSEMTNTSKKMLLAEIEKCEVLCANCHRIETYESRNK